MTYVLPKFDIMLATQLVPSQQREQFATRYQCLLYKSSKSRITVTVCRRPNQSPHHAGGGYVKASVPSMEQWIVAV